MPRPRKNRKIIGGPAYPRFKPAGIPATELETIILTLDELEALRLADFEGLYQEEAAELMEVSRQTFGNIITSARQKCAEALIHGKQLLIEGGDYEIDLKRKAVCRDCGRSRRSIKDASDFGHCPACSKSSGHGGRHRKGRGRQSPVQ
ncbi:MAG: DUF134 domain-containing protein [Spirochaetales bacterium]|jgi:predicted DNA-binding protein (UPF0251 family)|nr:DUF134 domain-containing protein [Spirochaetales bacterium]